MSRAYRPLAPPQLAERLADHLCALAVPGAALRVAVDGPRCADPVAFAGAVLDPLHARGRPATLIDAATFWRDASLRLEHGRDEASAYRTWLDEPALRREVIEPLGPGGSGAYLPSLRDPGTNRSTRAPARAAAPGEIVLVAGELLLGRNLPFDCTVHLGVSASARERRTDPAWTWTLVAWRDYDALVRPDGTANVVIRYDDPDRPAVSWATGPRASSR